MSPGDVVYTVPTSKKIVALTFDIAFGKQVPLAMLTLLNQIKVKKATFFVSGTWVDAHPNIAKRIGEKGFELASHGYLHRNYSRYSNAWIEQQVKKARRAIYVATGVKTNTSRTPSGDLNLRVIKKLCSMGQTIIQWGTDSLDWKMPGVGKIVGRVLNRVHPGDIVLLHACDTRTQTLKALSVIVDALRKRGYKLVTVSELLEERKYRKLKKRS
jgi:polysaccharide deacetylase family sporulation protein PdaB